MLRVLMRVLGMLLVRMSWVLSMRVLRIWRTRHRRRDSGDRHMLLRLGLHAGQVMEPGMVESISGRDAQLGTQLEHAGEQLDADGIDLGQDGAERLGGIHLPGGLVFREVRDARPSAFCGSAHDAEDALQLVFVSGTREQRASREHLGHDAAGRPDVDTGVVGAAAEQHVGSAIPKGDDLVRKGVDRDAERTGKTEVTKLQLALFVDEKVLRFQVAVQNSVLVTKVDALQQLVHEGLDDHGFESAALALGVHVLLKIAIHILENEHQLVLGVDDIVQSHNVLVLEFLHQRDLTDGRARGSLLRVEMNLLESDELACLAVAALEHLHELSASCLIS